MKFHPHPLNFLALTSADQSRFFELLDPTTIPGPISKDFDKMTKLHSFWPVDTVVITENGFTDFKTGTQITHKILVTFKLIFKNLTEHTFDRINFNKINFKNVNLRFVDCSLRPDQLFFILNTDLHSPGYLELDNVKFSEKIKFSNILRRTKNKDYLHLGTFDVEYSSDVEADVTNCGRVKPFTRLYLQKQHDGKHEEEGVQCLNLVSQF